MGIMIRREKDEDHLPGIEVVYATAAFDANHKNMRVPIHSPRSHFDGFGDERHPYRIRFDNNVRSFSEKNCITAENAERNGHPGMNAAPIDVRPRNIRPRLRRTPTVTPMLH